MKTHSNIKPKTFTFDLSGSVLYAFNVQEYEVEQHMGGGETLTETQYEYDTVRMYKPLTSNKVLQAVIAEKWDTDYEQKLVNEYNSAVMGLYDEETAAKKTAAYKAFLEARAALKAMVEADCKEAGIR